MAKITNDLGTFPVPYYTRSQRLLPIMEQGDQRKK